MVDCYYGYTMTGLKNAEAENSGAETPMAWKNAAGFVKEGRNGLPSLIRSIE